jgi:hypothetical protein
MRGAARRAELADVQGYAPGGQRATLGDVFADKLAGLNLSGKEGE